MYVRSKIEDAYHLKKLEKLYLPQFPVIGLWINWLPGSSANFPRMWDLQEKSSNDCVQISLHQNIQLWTNICMHTLINLDPKAL